MEEKSLKKAQVGAFIFALIGLLLLAVPFAFGSDIVGAMGFSKLKTTDGAFDIMAIFNAGFMADGATTTLLGITNGVAADAVAKLAFLANFETYIGYAFYYGFVGFWIVCILMFVFTLFGFINVGFFRFLNKLFAVICGVLTIVLAIISLLYLGLGAWTTIEAVGFGPAFTTFDGTAGCLANGIYLAILIHIVCWILCVNCFKIVKRKAAK